MSETSCRNIFTLSTLQYSLCGNGVLCLCHQRGMRVAVHAAQACSNSCLGCGSFTPARGNNTDTRTFTRVVRSDCVCQQRIGDGNTHLCNSFFLQLKSEKGRGELKVSPIYKCCSFYGESVVYFYYSLWNNVYLIKLVANTLKFKVCL